MESNLETLLSEAIASPKPAPPFRGAVTSLVLPKPLQAHFESQEGKLKSGKTMGDFDTTKHQALRVLKETAKSYVKDFLDANTATYGLYFSSDSPGSGKTLLACIIANTLSETNARIKTQILSTTEYLELIQRTYRDETLNEIGIMNALSSVYLLILDDLGKERHKRSYEGEVSWQEEQLDKLINQRIANDKATIYTSNLDVGDLPLSKRLMSRILGSCDVRVFPDVDIRMITRLK